VVRGALKGALRSLLIDLPSLVDLTLMDDTSTANRETQVWLREEGLMGPLTEEELEQREGGASSAPVLGRDVSDRARERVRAGQAEKAIEMLMHAADQEASPRGRSLRRAEAAAVMVDHGLAPVAMPILRDIMGQVEAHRLEEWEASEAIAVVMATLYRCIDRTGGDESEKEELYLRVCRLDPMQAIHFVKDNEGDEGGDSELEDA
jgi:type VI secretion system protein ImpA